MVSLTKNYIGLIVSKYIEPFVVEFVQTSYTVVEGEGQVEVCVNLTQPQTDILDEEIYMDVYRDNSSLYIPSHAELACKTHHLARLKPF